MQRISARVFVLVIVSAILQVFCFPTSGPIAAWRSAFSWIALVPLLIALLQKNRAGERLGMRAGFVVGYLCGFLWYLGNCSWIYQTMYLYGGMQKPVAFLILIFFSLYLGLYHALFSFLIAILNRSKWGVEGCLFLSPFVWTAVELLRSRLTGFPWDLLGNAQVDDYIATCLAPIGGVMAVSFFVAAINAAVCVPFLSARNRGNTPRLIAGLALVLVAAMQFKLRPVHEVASNDQQALLVQENISVGVVAKQDKHLTIKEEVALFSDLSLHLPEDSTPRDEQRQPTIIVWPEAPSNLRSDDPYVISSLSRLAKVLHTPIIAGGLGVDADRASARGYFLYDSALVFDRQGAFAGRYDKNHLVPWGEYVPYKMIFAFASKLTEGSSDMNPGRQRSIFHIAGHNYGVFICYESIFGDEVRRFVNNGAEVLVNISDDGWYGDTGAPWQHLNMARLRAIENQRWILRSTNTGETTVIDPQGRYVATQRHLRTAYLLPFSFSTSKTFYTRYGDWFAFLCAIVTIVALVIRVLTHKAPSTYSADDVIREA